MRHDRGSYGIEIGPKEICISAVETKMKTAAVQRQKIFSYATLPSPGFSKSTGFLYIWTRRKNNILSQKSQWTLREKKSAAHGGSSRSTEFRGTQETQKHICTRGAKNRQQ